MFTDLYEKLVSGEEKLSLVGLGYVGMPIAVAFAKKINVIGYDLNEKKIELYKNGIDPTREVGDEAIKAYEDYIKTQVLADTISIQPNDGAVVEFDDFDLNITVTKSL